MIHSITAHFNLLAGHRRFQVRHPPSWDEKGDLLGFLTSVYECLYVGTKHLHWQNLCSSRYCVLGTISLLMEYLILKSLEMLYL